MLTKYIKDYECKYYLLEQANETLRHYGLEGQPLLNNDDRTINQRFYETYYSSQYEKKRKEI